jgi:hypothetical protein
MTLVSAVCAACVGGWGGYVFSRDGIVPWRSMRAFATVSGWFIANKPPTLLDFN